jgi:hypothetical protein
MSIAGQIGSNQTRGTRISSGYTRKRARIVSALWLLFLLLMGRNALKGVRNQAPRDRASDARFPPADALDHEDGAMNAGTVVQPIGIVADPAEDAAPRHPGRAVSRRLLVATATAAALAAVVASVILAEHRISGHPTEPVGKASMVRQSPSTPGARPAKTRRAAALAATRSGRRLAWSPVANASAYTVEIVGSADLTYSATTRRPYLVIPTRWRQDGRRVTLSVGTYHWYVWPVFGNAARPRQARKAVVASVLVITP